MAYVILGIGVGCWMYSFVNYQWNDDPWIGSTPFFWLGLITIIISVIILVS